MMRAPFAVGDRVVSRSPHGAAGEAGVVRRVDALQARLDRDGQVIVPARVIVTVDFDRSGHSLAFIADDGAPLNLEHEVEPHRVAAAARRYAAITLSAARAAAHVTSEAAGLHSRPGVLDDAASRCAEDAVAAVLDDEPDVARVASSAWLLLAASRDRLMARVGGAR